MNTPPLWRRLAQQQAGLITRQQLAACNVHRWAIAHRVESERWQFVTQNVVAITTGELTETQRLWAAALHGGDDALVTGLAAAEHAGLRRLKPGPIEVLIPHDHKLPPRLIGVTYHRTRRNLVALRDRRSDLPRCRLEVAVLLAASAERTNRVSAGILSAAVQQRLTTERLLAETLDELSPLKKSRLLHTILDDIGGGMQSRAEMDVKRMCRQHRLVQPARQVQRRDGAGRLRFTDCEWRIADGRTVVLEVDGRFHMEVAHWEEDIARQRALAATDRLIVRCTSNELRDTPEIVARDLINLGIPRQVGGK